MCLAKFVTFFQLSASVAGTFFFLALFSLLTSKLSISFVIKMSRLFCRLRSRMMFLIIHLNAFNEALILARKGA